MNKKRYDFSLGLEQTNFEIYWFLTPIVWQPRRVHESGAGSLCCLSTRMCEFMTTPRSCARRGNPDFSRDAKRQGRPFFGSFICAVQRNERTFFFQALLRIKCFPGNCRMNPLSSNSSRADAMTLLERLVSQMIRSICTASSFS